VKKVASKVARERPRSLSLPGTECDMYVAKLPAGTTRDDLDLLSHKPFRGRLPSLPTTKAELREAKNGSALQKYVKPIERREPKTTAQRNGRASLRENVKPTRLRNNVGKPPIGRVSKTDISGAATVTPTTSVKSPVSSLIDSHNQHPGSANRFNRRSASLRVTSSAGSSVKAAAERANALVESRRVASVSVNRTGSKVGQAIRSKAVAKVDSRRSSTHVPQVV